LSSPRLSLEKSKTGILRHVRNLTADIHANIQQWNDLHLQGINYIKLILHEKQDNGLSENLRDLCDKLQDICDNLVSISFNQSFIIYKCYLMFSIQIILIYQTTLV